MPKAIAFKFDGLALFVASRGRKRYSADSILHRLRWHFDFDDDERTDGFKCNNNWTAPLARWFLARHPEFPKFFELRERVDDGYREAAE